MRVAFDCTTAAFSQKTGTGVYVEELVRNYERLFQEDAVIHTYRIARRIKGRRFLLPVAHPNTTSHTLLDPLTIWRGLGYDIFHGLNSRLPVLWGCKKIATIHDLFSLYGKFASEAFRETQMQHLLTMIDRADHIISVSEYTKTVMVERLGIKSDMISVVHNGVRDLFTMERPVDISRRNVKERFQLENYFLYVGALEARKNILGLIEAYNIFMGAHKSEAPKLVLVGHPSFGFEAIQKAIESSPYRAHIVQLGFTDNDDLDHLYRASLGLVYLSLEEGFGIPILEAMACGVPVLSSNTTSLPEAGYGFSWMVAPEDAAGAAHIMARFLKRDSELETKVRGGQKIARARTWAQVARETRTIYQKILS